MSVHVCKCGDEYHIRYPGLTQEEAQRLADNINGSVYDRQAVDNRLTKRGCYVCGLGGNGETMGYVCPRGDCPVRITCTVNNG